MDPPQRRYTFDDFLSPQKIAVRCDGSPHFEALLTHLLNNGYDNGRYLHNNINRMTPETAICYGHCNNGYAQWATVDTFLWLGYTVIYAENLLDIIVLPQAEMNDFLNFLENA